MISENGLRQFADDIADMVYDINRQFEAARDSGEAYEVLEGGLEELMIARKLYLDASGKSENPYA